MNLPGLVSDEVDLPGSPSGGQGPVLPTSPLGFSLSVNETDELELLGSPSGGQVFLPTTPDVTPNVNEILEGSPTPSASYPVTPVATSYQQGLPQVDGSESYYYEYPDVIQPTTMPVYYHPSPQYSGALGFATFTDDLGDVIDEPVPTITLIPPSPLPLGSPRDRHGNERRRSSSVPPTSGRDTGPARTYHDPEAYLAYINSPIPLGPRTIPIPDPYARVPEGRPWEWAGPYLGRFELGHIGLPGRPHPWAQNAPPNIFNTGSMAPGPMPTFPPLMPISTDYGGEGLPVYTRSPEFNWLATSYDPARATAKMPEIQLDNLDPPAPLVMLLPEQPPAVQTPSVQPPPVQLPAHLPSVHPFPVQLSSVQLPPVELPSLVQLLPAQPLLVQPPPLHVYPPPLHLSQASQLPPTAPYNEHPVETMADMSEFWLNTIPVADAPVQPLVPLLSISEFPDLARGLFACIGTSAPGEVLPPAEDNLLPDIPAFDNVLDVDAATTALGVEEGVGAAAAPLAGDGLALLEPGSFDLLASMEEWATHKASDLDKSGLEGVHLFELD
jgi:hypothetical protein